MKFEKDYFTKIYPAHKKMDGTYYYEDINKYFGLKGRKLRILEIGCATGNFLEKFYGDNFELYGMDVSAWALAKAKTILPRANFSQQSAEHLALKENFFDLVVSLHTVEHLKTPEHMLKEVNRILKNTGLFYMATPNLGSVHYFLGKFVKHYRDPDVTHVNVRSLGAWEKLLKLNNFKVLRAYSRGVPGLGRLRNFTAIDLTKQFERFGFEAFLISKK